MATMLSELSIYYILESEIKGVPAAALGKTQSNERDVKEEDLKHYCDY